MFDTILKNYGYGDYFTYEADFVSSDARSATYYVKVLTSPRYISKLLMVTIPLDVRIEELSSVKINTEQRLRLLEESNRELRIELRNEEKRKERRGKTILTMIYSLTLCIMSFALGTLL